MIKVNTPKNRQRNKPYTTNDEWKIRLINLMERLIDKINTEHTHTHTHFKRMKFLSARSFELRTSLICFTVNFEALCEYARHSFARDVPMLLPSCGFVINMFLNIINTVNVVRPCGFCVNHHPVALIWGDVRGEKGCTFPIHPSHINPFNDHIIHTNSVMHHVGCISFLVHLCKYHNWPMCTRTI